MLRILALFCLPLIAMADDWIEFRSGPFQVITNAGASAGQDALADLEQLRYVLGSVLRKEELRSIWPIRLVVFKSAKQAQAYPGGRFGMGRDSSIASAVANSPIPAGIIRGCAEALIAANAARMPREIEEGLAEFLSTLDAEGSRVTVGTAVAEPRRNLNWARLHLLVVDPEYFGKLQVLLYNLQRGVDPGPAYRNAFTKSPDEITREATARLKAGRFDTTTVSGKPINPRRDFKGAELTPREGEIVLADLLLLDPGRAAQAQAAYSALLKKNPEAPEPHEGLGFVELKAGRRAEAQEKFRAAAEAGSKNARVWFELGKSAEDAGKSIEAFSKAADLNPNWAEPHAEIAARDPDSRKKIVALRKATTLDPRNAGYLRALAETHLARDEYGDASRAWTAAEQASIDDAEKEKIRQARLAIEQQRLDFEAAERKRLAEEKEREVRKAKDAAMAEIRAAEERANRNLAARAAQANRNARGSNSASARLTGRLVQVDCRRGTLRLSIENEDRSLTRLLIRDAKKVVVAGGGKLDLACGPQAKPRFVAIDFIPKPNSAHGTAGEVSSIDLP